MGNKLFELIDLINNMLCVNPDDRISKGMVLAHKFFNQEIDSRNSLDIFFSKNLSRLQIKIVHPIYYFSIMFNNN